MTEAAPRIDRIVFVNHTSPARGDVSSLRMQKFAHAFAKRGIRALFLTGGGCVDGAATPVTALTQHLNTHDYATPLHIPCEPSPAPLVTRARTGKTLPPFRQLVIAASYLASGGIFPDWQRSAAPYLPIIAQAFRPQAVVGTFGNTDTWSIARTLARMSHAPWIADMKDNWDAFLPFGLAKIVAKRFNDMAHMTTYSESHSFVAERYFSVRKTVVYSGFDHIFEASERPGDADPTRINLVGSIYDPDKVAELLRAVAAWQNAKGLSDITLSYAGMDGEIVARVASELALPIALDIRGQIPSESLGALLRTSFANAYVVNRNSLFQQKPLELLAAGRPVIAIGHESDEIHKIRVDIGGHLIDGDNPGVIAQTLAALPDDISARLNTEALAKYGWDNQARILERIVADVIGNTP